MRIAEEAYMYALPLVIMDITRQIVLAQAVLAAAALHYSHYAAPITKEKFRRAV